MRNIHNTPQGDAAPVQTPDLTGDAGPQIFGPMQFFFIVLLHSGRF